jgi:hypothetical protein
MFIAGLQKLDAMGIYALRNDADKRIFISYGRNMLANFTRLLGALKTDKRNALMLADIEKLQLEIIETIPRDYVQNLKVKVALYSAKFQARGYELYREYRKPPQYKIEQIINQKFHVEVWLRSKYKYKLCVGVFKTVKESDDFIRDVYPDAAYIYPIYARNELTNEYRSRDLI